MAIRRDARKDQPRAARFWRVVGQESEVLETSVTKTRDEMAALKFLEITMERVGWPNIFVTDKLGT